MYTWDKFWGIMGPIVTILMLVSWLLIVSIANTNEAIQAKQQKLIDDCEVHLPRNEKCELRGVLVDIIGAKNERNE